MKYQLLILILAFAVRSYGQCEISKSTTDKGDIILETGIVKLFSSGNISAYTYSTMTVNSINNNQAKFMMIIMVISEKRSESFVPRKMKITFKDGNILSLNAEEKLPSKFENGKAIESCVFRPNLENAKTIIGNEVSLVEIEDHYLQENISGSPFITVLKDQYKCLMRDAKEL